MYIFRISNKFRIIFPSPGYDKLTAYDAVEIFHFGYRVVGETAVSLVNGMYLVVQLLLDLRIHGQLVHDEAHRYR